MYVSETFARTNWNEPTSTSQSRIINSRKEQCAPKQCCYLYDKLITVHLHRRRWKNEELVTGFISFKFNLQGSVPSSATKTNMLCGSFLPRSFIYIDPRFGGSTINFLTLITRLLSHWKTFSPRSMYKKLSHCPSNFFSVLQCRHEHLLTPRFWRSNNLRSSNLNSAPTTSTSLTTSILLATKLVSYHLVFTLSFVGSHAKTAKLLCRRMTTVFYWPYFVRSQDITISPIAFT